MMVEGINAVINGNGSKTHTKTKRAKRRKHQQQKQKINKATLYHTLTVTYTDTIYAFMPCLTH